MTRRIGSTTYKVKVIFCDNGGETMEEKILRMISRNCGFRQRREPQFRVFVGTKTLLTK